MIKQQDKAAYPGDTYIDDLTMSAQVKKPWLRFFVPVIAFAVFSDFYFMQDTIALLMGWSAFDSLPRVINDGQYGFLPTMLFTILVAGSMVATYIFIGRLAGKRIKEYLAFGRGRNLNEVCITLGAEIIALAGFTFLRYCGEMLNPGRSGAVDPIISTLFMTLIMLLAAVLMILYTYYSGDCVIEEISRSSAAHLSDDKSLYEHVFAEVVLNNETECAYEAEELSIDNEAIRSAFRLSSLCAQLNGIVDPADASEFQQISSMVKDGLFDLTAREQQ